jgi:hypothetical protein
MLAGGFALAIAPPAIGVFAVAASAPTGPSIAACTTGESEDLYTPNCVPDLVPNSPYTQIPGSPLLAIDGVPCTGRDSGSCIGLAENAVPEAVPQSTVSSSP